MKSFGFNIAFLGLAAIAFAGMLVFALFMPETRELRSKSCTDKPFDFAAAEII